MRVELTIERLAGDLEFAEAWIPDDDIDEYEEGKAKRAAAPHWRPYTTPAPTRTAERIAELEHEVETLTDLMESRCVPSGTPQIVCLCGSTRFMDAFHAAGWQFTLDDEIVLSVGVCKHAEHHGGEALGPDVAAKLDELHMRKIDLADRVFVLNVGGYIGESTRAEIDYAKSKGKRIDYLEHVDASNTRGGEG